MWDVCQTAVFEEWWVELSEQEQDEGEAVLQNDDPQGRRALRRTPQDPASPTQAMTRSFSALTKDLGPERRVRIEQRKEQLRQEMTLAELRRAFSLTQDTLARTLNVKQAEISKIENRADMLMSTLRNFVQAMGGDLEVRAVFPDRAIEISTFSSLAGKPAKIRTGKKQQQVLAEA